MVAHPQTAWLWNPLAESPEQAEEKRKADKAFEIRWETADFQADAEWLRESLWYKPFVPPEEEVQVASLSPQVELPPTPTDEEMHNDRLYDRSSPEWKIYDRIAHRIDTEFWGNPEILNPELFEEWARKRNQERADELFFSKNVLEEDMRHTGKKSPTENLETNTQWFETNMWEEGVLHEAYERIRGNFVLPPYISGNNLEEIYENGWKKDAVVVNGALSDAILLEVEQHTLAGRMNYPKEEVETLMKEITDPQNSPFEKLLLFGKIHTLVETGVGGRWKKQNESFRNTQRRAAIAQEKADAFQAIQAQKIQTAEARNIPWAVEETTTQKVAPQGWDIFTAGDLDRTWWNKEAERALS